MKIKTKYNFNSIYDNIFDYDDNCIYGLASLRRNIIFAPIQQYNININPISSPTGQLFYIDSNITGKIK